jgi:3-oxoacyl-[acyl-carrier protein] reductase
MIALVTGAGSGIGAAIALRLGRDGHTVAVNDLMLAAAEETAAQIRENGGQATAYGADVSDEQAVNDMVAKITEDHGAPEILVNNAGFGHQALFMDIAPEMFDKIFAVHVRGNFLCTRACLPAMLAKGQGHIINIASQLGQIGGVELTHYAGAKAAIIGMTKSLAREVSDKGVRVNAVAPGRSTRLWSRRFLRHGKRPNARNCRWGGSAILTRWGALCPSSSPMMPRFSWGRRSGRIPAM